ncbi:hypothetical protein ACOI22_12790 [Glaciecola sp. 2405UD65-10]|uniref:hypothetical protein n=1 Tax=Glaciecola sp. 2405UD65-10 TaxID=3397244 RepID=UPI003B5B3F46
MDSRQELNRVSKALEEAMENKWYVIFDVTYLCISDEGAILFGCTATITGQTEKDLFSLR